MITKTDTNPGSAKSTDRVICLYRNILNIVFLFVVLGFVCA